MVAAVSHACRDVSKHPSMDDLSPLLHMFFPKDPKNAVSAFNGAAQLRWAEMQRCVLFGVLTSVDEPC